MQATVRKQDDGTLMPMLSLFPILKEMVLVVYHTSDVAVVDAAVEQAYQATSGFTGLKYLRVKKQLHGAIMIIYHKNPDIIQTYKVAIKGPLTTPVGDAWMAQYQLTTNHGSMCLPTPCSLLYRLSKPTKAS